MTGRARPSWWSMTTTSIATSYANCWSRSASSSSRPRSGAECLALAGECRPNLVLLDVSMPEMDGWEVARQLRQTLRERPAIVMLSAITLEKERELAPDRAYDDYMNKPIDLRQLLEKFQTLARHKMDHEVRGAGAGLRAAARANGAQPAACLPVEELDALIALGQIGHHRGIRAKLDEIDRRLPELAASSAELRAILGSFNLSRLLAILETQRKNHAR